MSGLPQLIAAEIAAAGPMRFDQFMERALYHPQLGYYARQEAPLRTGRGGDFFTSVSVGPLFGRLLAGQIFQMWELLGRPSPFRIAEQGANDGQLAVDILEWCRERDANFFAALMYNIVEPLEAMRARQRKRCAQNNFLGQISWLAEPVELAQEKIPTVFLANELVDAFPVRVVRFGQGEWRERHVVGQAGEFGETYLPISDAVLIAAVEPLPRIEGYTTEINLHAWPWMGEVARAIPRGYIVIVDYGFSASAFYAPFRTAGTLSAYRAHRRSESILADAGEQDITAHVDFTALARVAESEGWRALALVDQQHFLTGIAEADLAGGECRFDLSRQLAAWNTLTHPAHLGSRFHALVLAKEAPEKFDGLRFSRPGCPD